MKKLFSTLLMMALCVPAGASGVVTVNGELVSITEKAYVVRTERSTFEIDKQAVPKSSRESLERSSGKRVSISAPFSAVTKLKTKPKR